MFLDEVILKELAAESKKLREGLTYTDEGGWGDEAQLADNGDLHGDKLFLSAKPGERVLMHLNLGTKWRTHGMKTWSVKDIRGSKTIGHIQGAVLENATFVTREYGNILARVADEKTVHAWVDGKLAATQPPSTITASGVPVKYNPHLPGPERHPSEGGHYSFMRQDAQGNWTIPIKSAKRVHLTATWGVFAEGIVDWDVAPTIAKEKETSTLNRYVAGLKAKGQDNKVTSILDKINRRPV